MEFLVVNAQHMKAAPDRNRRELHELVPSRKFEERAKQHNQIKKVLDQISS